MSIIANALKKAQDKRSKNAEDLVPPVDTQDFVTFLKTKALEKKKNDSTRKIVGLAVLFIAAFIVFTFLAITLFYGSKTTNPSVDPTTSAVLPVSPKTPAPLESNASENNASPETLEQVVPVETDRSGQYKMLPSLNGIMYSPVNPQVILNGEIYSVGETINGFSIKKILSRSIILTAGNEEFTVNLR